MLFGKNHTGGMKLFSILLPLLLLMQSQSRAEPLAEVKKLIEQGNHREAANLGKKALEGKPAEADMLLRRTVDALTNLNEFQEAEDVTEAAAKTHAQDWQLLVAAGEVFFRLPHAADIIDGKRKRSQPRYYWGRSDGDNDSVSLEQWDRVRSLQLYEAAWKALPADSTIGAKASALRALETGLTYNRHGSSNAWALQALTDLSTLPEPEAGTGLENPATGYPADKDGNPVYFKTPATWQAAISDGERLMWIMAEQEKLDAANAHNVRNSRALLAKAWFSVETLGGLPITFSSDDEGEGDTRSAITALHTLKDEETVVRLATGPKRVTLPKEWRFMEQLKAMSEDESINQTERAHIQMTLAEEWMNRRQYVQADEALSKGMALLPPLTKEAQKILNELGHHAMLLPTGNAEQDLLVQFHLKHYQITAAQGSLEAGEAQPAGKEATLSLVFRNAEIIRLSARRVNVEKLLADVEAYLRSSPKEHDWNQANIQQIGQRLMAEEGEKYLLPEPVTWEQKLEPRGKHWDKRVTVNTPLKEAGAWLVEGSFDGGHKTRALIWLEGLVLVKTQQSDATLYYLADAVTGAPVPDVTVRFFGYRTEWVDRNRGSSPRQIYKFNDFQLKTDAKGQAKANLKQRDGYNWLIQAKDGQGRLAFQGFDHFYNYGRQPGFAAGTRVYTITDRPVYRPGQEVKWKSWIRTVSYDPKAKSNNFAGDNIEVIITNPRGEEVQKKTLKADESGAVNDVLVLEDEATLGNYTLTLLKKSPFNHRSHLGMQSFRVEEYKKPEFEVKVDAPLTPISLGDSFEIKIKADYYFGGPVKEGKVKYKVERAAHTKRWFPRGRWDWLFGEGYGWGGRYYSWYPRSSEWCICLPPYPWFSRSFDPPELVADGEAALDADGTYTVKIDTALAKELHGDEDHSYAITAEVTDQSRRTLFGSGSVLAARRPYEVYVSADRGYYQTGESGDIRVHARTLDGRAVKGSGTLTLYRITYNASGEPAEEAVRSVELSLKGEEDAVGFSERFEFSRGGQYRVAAKVKDEAGHEVEGTTFITVRGEGFAEGRDFRFDALELLVQKEEYKPGEEVEITVNTNRAGSTVALFIRAQNGVYGDPVWLKLEGKSTTHRFKLDEADQPNLFIEAYTVSDAAVHRITQQILVPPTKRIASVKLIPDGKTYLPGQGAKVKVQVKDESGNPFTGKVVLTAYDKALEYISGGSNQGDIRSHFWGWKRSHHSQIQDSLRRAEMGLFKKSEPQMQPLGIFGDMVADEELGDDTASITLSGGVSVLTKSGSGDMRRSSMAGIVGDAPAAASAMAAPAPPPAPASAPGEMAVKAEGNMAMDPFGSASGEPEGPQPTIRTNLADSAVWIADFTTDEKGEGEFNFNLPDNLTTWKLRSWVMGPDTQVGEAGVEVITRKNLMVRLQAPRFFVEKDEVVISANVHNEMDEYQNVSAVLELEGGVLEFANGSQGTVPALTVKGHGEHRFDWKVKVTGEGEARIRVKALAQKDSDAMEMTFPAYIHGMLKTDAWSLALRADQAAGSLTFKVPAERKPEQSRLEIRYSPTLAMALVDALPYLVDYPYGCTEQTLNRFVPTVMTQGVLKELGVNLKQVQEKITNLNAQEIGKPEDRARRWQGKDQKGKAKVPVFDEDEVKKMAATGLKRLEAMRNSDGGWGWFPGGRESSGHITALVLHGLKSAEQSGMDVNDGVIRNGLEWLKRHEAKELARLKLPDQDRNHKAFPDNLDALIHCVLVEYKAGNKDMRTRLYEDRKHLSRYNLALLGLACHAEKETQRRDMCLRNLNQFLKQDDENQTAWLVLPEGGWWWYWYENQIETQAAYLRLLVAVDAGEGTAARVVKYLLNNRRNGTWWNSTKDTAAVIEALALYAKASGESKPEQTVEVLVDGKSVKKVEITKENLFTFDGTVVLEGDELTTGEHTVELRKLGTAPLYANAYLTVFSQEDMIPSAGLEVKARRKFYRLIEEKPDQQVAGSSGQLVNQKGFKYRREEIASDAQIKSGDLIEVELSVDSKNDYEYVIIEDMKPAGFEPVEVQSGWNYDGLASYQEYRDEKVAFFADRLPRGTHNLRYRVKAEIPGRFSALPAKVEAMYAPELKGNSDEWKAKISDR